MASRHISAMSGTAALREAGGGGGGGGGGGAARFRPAKHYLRVRVEFEEEDAVAVTPLVVLGVARGAVRSMFGVVGQAAHPVGVLEAPGNGEALLWTDFDSAVQVRAALTLYGSHDGKRVAVRVLDGSAHLAALAAPPRA